MSEEKVGIVITKSPDFKLVYTTGLFGSLNPMEGRMIFYVDRMIPKIVKDIPGNMKTGSIERELQVEVHMSPSQFLSIFHWMKDHIERLKKQGVLVEKRKGKKS